MKSLSCRDCLYEHLEITDSKCWNCGEYHNFEPKDTGEAQTEAEPNQCRLSNEDVIYQLKSLIDHAETFRSVDYEGDEGIWAKDIKALNIAIEAILKYEKLLNEVIDLIYKLTKAEFLLQEVESFCPVIQKNEIREFLRG